MTVNAYCELGATAGTRLKYRVILSGFADARIARDTVEVGITGKRLRHVATNLRDWIGRIVITGDEGAGYGTIANLRALYDLKTSLSFLPPETTAVDVMWTGNWAPEYIRGPLDVLMVGFMFSEVE